MRKTRSSDGFIPIDAWLFLTALAALIAIVVATIVVQRTTADVRDATALLGVVVVGVVAVFALSAVSRLVLPLAVAPSPSDSRNEMYESPN